MATETQQQRPETQQQRSETTATNRLTPEERYELLRGLGAECVEEEELKKLLQAKEHPVVYDGFEPSGRMHIAQALLKAISVNKQLQAGCKSIIWIADWFAKMNNKCGGDLEKIKSWGATSSKSGGPRG